jgi:hypothetical protein
MRNMARIAKPDARCIIRNESKPHGPQIASRLRRAVCAQKPSLHEEITLGLVPVLREGMIFFKIQNVNPMTKDNCDAKYSQRNKTLNANA